MTGHGPTARLIWFVGSSRSFPPMFGANSLGRSAAQCVQKRQFEGRARQPQRAHSRARVLGRGGRRRCVVACPLGLCGSAGASAHGRCEVSVTDRARLGGLTILVVFVSHRTVPVG